MTAGRIIDLNGTSSSGQSTLAKALQAAAQFAVVHAHGGAYDVEVDTSESSPDSAAARIVAVLGQRRSDRSDDR